MSCSGGTAVEGPVETPLTTTASAELSPVVPPAAVAVGISNSIITSKCPWGKAKSPEPVQPVSLRDIMSEQLASSLQVQEEEKLVKEMLQAEGIENPEKIDLGALQAMATSSSDDCSSDFLIAQMLQMQFNKEYDHNLKKQEEKFNGGSKVSVNLHNFMINPSGSCDDDSSEDEEYEENPKKKAWDKFDVILSFYF